MIKIIINLIFCLIAGSMTYWAPERYDFDFCLGLLVLYIINNIIYFLGNKTITHNAANFDFFFMFSYGMVNFIYPVFYMLENPNVAVFSMTFNTNIISKSTAIAYLAYTFYLLGISVYHKNRNKLKTIPKVEDKPDFKVNNLFLRLIFIIGIISFLGYVVTGGLTQLQNVYAGKNTSLSEVGVFSYFNNIFIICANLLAIFVFLVKDLKTKLAIFIFLAICSLLLLATGSRTAVLGIGLILVASYGRFVKRITSPKLILFLLIGSFAMTLVQLTREDKFDADVWAKNVENTQFDTPFDVFLDLISNNRNLYVLVDFADRYGNLYFLTTLTDLTSPVPGLSNYVGSLTGVPKELTFGGALPTYLEFGSDSDWGIGTNMIGEMYVGFGYYGVCIIMFLLGLLLNRTNRASNKNIYAFIIYYLLVSHAVFYPRAFYLYQPRSVVWSLIIVAVLLKITKSLYGKNRPVNKKIQI